MDGRLGCNPLKGAPGDALHEVMCGAGHNLRMILAALRLYCARFELSMQSITQHWPLRPVTTNPPAAENGFAQGRVVRIQPPVLAI